MYKDIPCKLPQKMGGGENIKIADVTTASAILLDRVKCLAEKYLHSRFHPQGQHPE